MVRSIIAVVASYIAMVILIMGAFAGMWFGMGPDRLLEPGLWTGNVFLCIAAPAITLIFGLFGGWMCAKIGRSTKPVMVLAGVVLVLGMLTAYFTLQKPEPTGPRAPGMSMTEIMEKGREPTWLAIFNPIGGAAAVLIGGLCIAAPRKPS
jgi:hypothetical protein